MKQVAGGTYNKKVNLKMTNNKTTYASRMNHPQKVQPSTIGASHYRHNHEPTQSRVNTIKVSLQKSQQIGQNQYKKAMKHMKLMNSLQKQSRQKQRDTLQIITQEHTFKPKINTKSQLNYLYEGHSLSAEKIHFLKNTGAQERERNEMKFYDRLIKWGKTNVDKRRDEFIRVQTGRESIQKLQKIAKKPAILIDLEESLSSIGKHQQNYTVTSSRAIYQTPTTTAKKQSHTIRPYINGEQKFYQKQAKAVAIRNGETYYYNSISQHHHHHDDLNVTR